MGSTMPVSAFFMYVKLHRQNCTEGGSNQNVCALDIRSNN